MQRLILLLAVLIPAVTVAQGTTCDPDYRSKEVIITDDNGKFKSVIAAPQLALKTMQEEKDWSVKAAVTAFWQINESYSTAELDAFADELGRVALESPSERVAAKALDA